MYFLLNQCRGMSLTGPTTSDTWDTVVPEAAPRYKTLAPGFYNLNNETSI